MNTASLGFIHSCVQMQHQSNTAKEAVNTYAVQLFAFPVVAISLLKRKDILEKGARQHGVTEEANNCRISNLFEAIASGFLKLLETLSRVGIQDGEFKNPRRETIVNFLYNFLDTSTDQAFSGIFFLHLNLSLID